MCNNFDCLHSLLIAKTQLKHESYKRRHYYSFNCQLGCFCSLLEIEAKVGSITMVRQSGSFFHGSTRLRLAILQNHTRSFKSLQSLENSAIKGKLANCFILNDVGWVCETGNVLRDYNFPGMLGKMHACVVSVYQAVSKKKKRAWV